MYLYFCFTLKIYKDQTRVFPSDQRDINSFLGDTGPTLTVNFLGKSVEPILRSEAEVPPSTIRCKNRETMSIWIWAETKTI